MVACSPLAFAQETSPAPQPALVRPNIAPDADPATATRAWLDTVPADKKAKSDAYFEGGYWLLLWDFLISSAIALLLLETRISARLRDFAERHTPFKAMQVVHYTIPYLLLTLALMFPFTVYEQFFREHKYDLATQTFRRLVRRSTESAHAVPDRAPDFSDHRLRHFPQGAADLVDLGHRRDGRLDSLRQLNRAGLRRAAL